ncbi:hypothetical protein [Nocardia sp. R7R-8]
MTAELNGSLAARRGPVSAIALPRFTLPGSRLGRAAAQQPGIVHIVS